MLPYIYFKDDSLFEMPTCEIFGLYLPQESATNVTGEFFDNALLTWELLIGEVKESVEG